jgi:maltooligosyltrehalose trehalohydrolase
MSRAANDYSATSLGAIPLDDSRCRFCVWASKAKKVELLLPATADQPGRTIPLCQADGEAGERGYFETVAENCPHGTRYFFRLDGGSERPDPASRWQPDGVHKASAVFDWRRFAWSDSGWKGLALENYIIYEIHTGCFTPEGTFDAVIPHLDELKALGITAIELMPVAQFPGARNWGYDGVHPFAAQNTYGGPEGFQRLVDACHARGLAVVLDVVYNHLGPEGNYLGEFAHYFTDRYRTPWGPAVNFDAAHSDEVRRFFIENALWWVREMHVDALRLDAVHAIVDNSAYPFLEELGQAVHAEAARLGRPIYLMPESDKNDPRLVRERARGGYGLDAVWNDDFHHAVHALLTGEHSGYYADFGQLRQLAKSFREGFIYDGQYSRYRGRRHGQPSRDIPAPRLVVFSQNHDQVGNRAIGDRLTTLLSEVAGEPLGFASLKLAAAAVLLSPFLPLLFMGEEYGETAPFQYFTSHSDPQLIENVRRGRRKEFAAFGWSGDIPDPQDEETFLRSKLNHALGSQPRHRALRDYYAELIRLRQQLPALRRLSKEETEAICSENENFLLLLRGCPAAGTGEVAALFHFGLQPARITVPLPAGQWRKRLDSTDARWAGSGSILPDAVNSTGQFTHDFAARSAILLERTG